MDFDEAHEEQEEEIGMHQMQSGNHQSRGGGDGVSAAARKSVGGGGGGGSGSGGGGGGGGSTTTTTYRYRECLKNHAVGIGGHALDGCGEFMAAGDEGTLESLKCAACNCHRNFHRKEAEGEGFHHPHPTSHHPHPHPHHHPAHHQQFSTAYSFRSPHPSGYLHVTPPTRPLALPSTSREEEDVSNPSSSGGGGGSGGGVGGSKKRFRTKFTPDQKEKMLAFAERLGWRIQKQDEALVQQFCAETNVRRHVLKVWMHNNKHTLGKKP